MRRAVAVLLVAALPSCTVGVRREPPKARVTRTSTATGSAAAPVCRTTYAAPDPHRPKVTLTFDVDVDQGDTYVGSERVVFTPDRTITEVVFRLWPNGPESPGARLDVYRASLPMRTESAGGTAERPTLLALALPKPSPAGRPVTVDLDFVLTLPKAGVDRWGLTGRTAWWSSGHPLLAWVRGAGWATEPAVGLLGETATSEVADYDVTVTAPGKWTVLGNGVMDEPQPNGLRTRRWHFRNPRARDVAVVVGPFAVRRSRVGGVPLTVAVSEELATGTEAEAVFGPVTANAVESLQAYVRRFGPFPFPALTVVALDPIGSAGVEYPGLVLVGSKRYDVVVPHEVAHQWFYGLVGNDQARDPWLDESFATYAEALFNDDADHYLDTLGSGGRVGEPMAYWDGHRRDYGRVVYAKGAAALLTARQEAGASLFDALVRCYVNEHAYRVATPADLADALSAAPRAIAVLREAGALPG
jgi:hypothetical protein